MEPGAFKRKRVEETFRQGNKLERSDLGLPGGAPDSAIFAAYRGLGHMPRANKALDIGFPARGRGVLRTDLFNNKTWAEKLFSSIAPRRTSPATRR